MAMGRPWYPHYLDDYARDTAHLTMLQHGAYRLLLDHYYATGPLPPEIDQICRISRAFSNSEIDAVQQILAEFFSLKHGKYHQKRSDKELRIAQTLCKSKSLAGRAGGIAARGKSGRKPNNKTIADELQNNTHPHPHPHPQRTSNNNSSFNGGHGEKNGDKSGDKVTIEDPKERLSRFQAKLARRLGQEGWGIVAAALDGDPLALTRCKAAAKEMGKGWPRQWGQA